MSRLLLLPTFVSGMFLGHGDPRAAMVCGCIGVIWAVALRTRRVFR